VLTLLCLAVYVFRDFRFGDLALSRGASSSGITIDGAHPERSREVI
jgi:hypothetical protein